MSSTWGRSMMSQVKVYDRVFIGAMYCPDNSCGNQDWLGFT